MDLQTRKIEFIQEFLKIQSVEVIERLENLLNREREITVQFDDSMAKSELNNRIERSEQDFKNNKFKSSDDLLSKYE